MQQRTTTGHSTLYRYPSLSHHHTSPDVSLTAVTKATSIIPRTLFSRLLLCQWVMKVHSKYWTADVNSSPTDAIHRINHKQPRKPCFIHVLILHFYFHPLPTTSLTTKPKGTHRLRIIWSSDTLPPFPSMLSIAITYSNSYYYTPLSHYHSSLTALSLTLTTNFTLQVYTPLPHCLSSLSNMLLPATSLIYSYIPFLQYIHSNLLLCHSRQQPTLHYILILLSYTTIRRLVVCDSL